MSAPQLTKRELDVMAVIWQAGSATVAEIVERVGAALHYSTILTICRTLEAKGHVRHHQDGRAFRYTAVTKADDAGASAIRRLVSKVFQGSREMLVARLVSSEDITADELKRMREQLDRRLAAMDG